MFFLTIMLSLILALSLLLIYYLTSFNMNMGMEEKMTPFECGFDPLSKMRAPFSTRFFLLVVLFLVFDVEVALLFPVLSAFYLTSSINMLWVFIMFVMILLFGLFHEWNEGSLEWVAN